MMDFEKRFGPSPYNHSMSDVFLGAKSGQINFEYFRPYFDEVSLPIDLARECIGEHYSQNAATGAGDPFIKFITLSALRRHERLPPYHIIKDELVDYRDVDGFTLAGPLSMWGGKNLYASAPCVFISHRWLTPVHPDPDGAHSREIIRRFDERPSSTPHEADELGEVYMWIDFCCLPQPRSQRLSTEDQQRLHDGLKLLPELVKSCELMILDSPDYIERAWCYTEFCIWLCKLKEITAFSGVLPRSKVFPAKGIPGDAYPVSHTDRLVRFLAARGYGGSRESLLQIDEYIERYSNDAIESASYNMGAYDDEYVPNLIAFMCTSWYRLRQMPCTESSDKAICLNAIVKALKFANRRGLLCRTVGFILHAIGAIRGRMVRFRP